MKILWKKFKNIFNSLNKLMKENKEPNVNLTLNPNKQIEKDINRSFFSGHLFLRKIYYDWELIKFVKH